MGYYVQSEGGIYSHSAAHDFLDVGMNFSFTDAQQVSVLPAQR